MEYVRLIKLHDKVAGEGCDGSFEFAQHQYIAHWQLYGDKEYQVKETLGKDADGNVAVLKETVAVYPKIGSRLTLTHGITFDVVENADYVSNVVGNKNTY